MLLNIHVKNIALINEVEITLGPGLNVISGETGAGKSLVIDSVNFALGSKIPKGIIREDGYALSELTFMIDDRELKEKIEKLGVIFEDDNLILSRRILNNRATARINGETVSSGILKQVSSLLIDIHGQHEHQSLLYKSRHLEILDEFLKDKLNDLLPELSGLYSDMIKVRSELKSAKEKNKDLEREKSLLKFEASEIEAASLKEGEDEELEAYFKRMQNSKNILESLNLVHTECGYEDPKGAGASIGRALLKLKQAEKVDEGLSTLTSLLTDIDSLLNDFNRDTGDYEQSLEFSEADYNETEERLNTINRLKGRFGGTIPEVLKALSEKKELLERYEHFEEYLTSLENKENELLDKCLRLSLKISDIRKQGAKELSAKIEDSLSDMNFLEAKFEIKIESDKEKLNSNGIDEAEFMISTNPGEKLKPLTEVVSGGELSRIMLALKTVFAGRDKISTLIFDEIDTGISGRTAQKVSEKLSRLSLSTQVICITHLPQIAAMGDSHFEIKKEVKDNRTETTVRELKDEEITEELARMLSGAEVTENVLESAKEMKRLADGLKKENVKKG